MISWAILVLMRIFSFMAILLMLTSVVIWTQQSLYNMSKISTLNLDEEEGTQFIMDEDIHTACHISPPKVFKLEKPLNYPDYINLKNQLRSYDLLRPPSELT